MTKGGSGVLWVKRNSQLLIFLRGVAERGGGSSDIGKMLEELPEEGTKL